MMRTLSILTCLSFVIIFNLTSCSSILSIVYGLKNTKEVDDKKITYFANKYNIPLKDSYELDIAYLSYLSSLDTTKYANQIKNHIQPLQVLYYNKSGNLISFQVNCYAGGFPNLKWNRNEIMTTFPPKQQTPLDGILSLETQIKYLKPLSKSEKSTFDNYDIIIFVYWNRFMGRQSKRLIHFVQKNRKLEKEQKVKIIYVNNDNIYAQSI